MTILIELMHSYYMSTILNNTYISMYYILIYYKYHNN